jgi:tetratricopeptide (TPR) repeat protein
VEFIFPDLFYPYLKINCMKKIYFILPLAFLFGTIGIWGFSFYTKKNSETEKVVAPQSTTIVSGEWARTKSAIDQFKEKLKVNPADQETKLLLSLAYIQAARLTGEHPYYYPLALKLADEVIHDNLLKNTSLAYEGMVAKASIQLSLHDFKGGLETGTQALSLRKDNAAIYGVLVDANVEIGNYEEAVNMSDKMVAIRPDIRSYSRISYLREIYGDVKGSIEALNLAVSAGMPGLEQTEWARITLAQLYERNGDLQNAEGQYRMALQESPDYAFALGGLGRIEAKKKNYDAALKLFNQAAQKIPEFSFHEEMADVYLVTNKKEQAIKKAQEVIVMLKEDAAAGHNSDLEFANVYAYLLGNYEEALKYGTLEYNKRPNNIDVAKALAYIHYKKKDYKKASFFMQKALRTNKSAADLLCLSGMIAYQKGEKQEGLKAIKKGLAMDPFLYDSLMLEAKSYTVENNL